ncbi:MAG: adenylyl-sulfate kinase [Bacteroidetes bacterium GWE2_29_8]|nr:MAG: adenylyl-sulfate kinase [Bacteroidetes bacterium GWE2_29_8]OFY22834.1 MAG: adenylyl-sulfate kinase [Bacteroidetes bacterium GWF2_29_10]
MISREEKELKIGQKGKVIWLTGLSGAGKTTLGILLENELFEMGYMTKVLDGDTIRKELNYNLGYSLKDREENNRRVAEISKMFVSCGIITICCFISPTEQIRNSAKSIIGEDDFIEVYINSSLEVCKQRDVKGLYTKAINGEIKYFTGISSDFDIPLAPDIEIRTDILSEDESLNKLLNFILTKVSLK